MILKTMMVVKIMVKRKQKELRINHLWMTGLSQDMKHVGWVPKLGPSRNIKNPIVINGIPHAKG